MHSLYSNFNVISLVPLNTGIMRNNKYGLDVNEIISMNTQGYLLRDIAKHYECKYQVLQSWLKVRNLKLVDNPINKDVNHNFFETIDTELKAYLLGFFSADGCVYNSCRIGVLLAEKDKEIVELFKDSISPKSEIKISHNIKGANNRQPQHLIRISSKRIVESLKKYGIGPRKTYSLMVLPNIESCLVPHFIRGYFDGDGHVGLKNGKYNTYLRVNISNGAREILDSIKEALAFKGIVSYVNARSNNCHHLEINSKESVKSFYSYIYSGCNFYLPRKRDIFNTYYDNTELTSNPKKLLAA